MISPAQALVAEERSPDDLKEIANAMETTVQDLIERIDNLEMKVTYQDEVIEELNAVIVKQWSAFEQLQRRLDGLEKRQREAQDNSGQVQQDEPPPPHY